MNQASPTSIQSYFSQITDPRVERTRAYELLDIIVIAICAVICGADDWVEIAEWGEGNVTWLREFIPLENGIPSHDTFGRVFSRIDAEQFQAAFLSWVQAVLWASGGHRWQTTATVTRRTAGKSSDLHGECLVEYKPFDVGPTKSS